LLLALLLAASHVALAVHVTAHSGLDLGQCALCISHAKSPSATLQSSYVNEHYIPFTAELKPLHARGVQRVSLSPYQTRAPPFIV